MPLDGKGEQGIQGPLQVQTVRVRGPGRLCGRPGDTTGGSLQPAYCGPDGSRNLRTFRSEKLNQFHTPFIDDDPLWLPFGEERNKTIDSILAYTDEENRHFVVNSKEQFELMRGNWGYKCPNWRILPLDYRGNIKMPCCMGSANEGALQPQCDKCGLAPYSGVLAGVVPDRGKRWDGERSWSPGHRRIPAHYSGCPVRCRAWADSISSSSSPSLYISR